MGDFDGLETIEGMMQFKQDQDELINCDKCGNPFFTKNKYRFYCDDCYSIIQMQEAIKIRNWGDKLVQRKWNAEAKANRLALIAKYGKPCQSDNNQAIVE